MTHMSSTHTYPIGTRVSCVLTCPGDHQWRALGTVGQAGSINLGTVREPGGGRDPMFCPVCHELMTQVLLVVAVGAKQHRNAKGERGRRP